MLRCPPTRIELKSDDGRSELSAARAARAREAIDAAATSAAASGAAAPSATSRAEHIVRETRGRVGLPRGGATPASSR